MKFSIKNLIATQLLLIGLVGSSYGVPCPDAKSIKPCVCADKDGVSEVRCGGADNPLDLKNVFSIIGAKGKIQFDHFYLTNGAITTLDDYVFGNVSFTIIEISDAYSLKKVSKNSLIASANTIQEFKLTGDSSFTDENAPELFEALSSLTSLNRIFLDLIKVKKIPDYAFKVVNGRQTLLNSIHMNFGGAKFGSLESVGNYAFYVLDNLNYVSIANQPIKLLKEHSFDFERPNSIKLQLYLDATHAKESIYEPGIFMNAKRSMEIELMNNNLEGLSEKVWKNVLDLPEERQVILNVDHNEFGCNCDMRWMVAGKDKYQYRVLGADCYSTGDSIFDLNLNATRFANCH